MVHPHVVPDDELKMEFGRPQNIPRPPHKRVCINNQIAKVGVSLNHGNQNLHFHFSLIVFGCVCYVIL